LISEPRTIEGELRRSETQLRQAAELAELAFWDWDVAADRWNYRGCFDRILGISCEALGADPAGLFRFIHPDDRDVVLQARSRIFEGESTAAFEHRFVRPDGGVRTVYSHVEAHRDSGGQLTRIFGAVQDITNRRRAANILHETVHLNQMLLDSMPAVAFLVQQSDWKVVAANRAAKELGVTPGRKCHEGFAGLGHPCPWCLAAESRPLGTNVGLELECRGRVWDTHWVWISHEHFLHYAIDITDRKRNEERLQHLQAQLAHVARLSTLGEMMAGIAHEVNQPLYAIVNFAKACTNLLDQEHADLDLVRKWNQEMVTGATRAAEIIRRARSFVRRSDAARTDMSINEVVAEAVQLLSVETRCKNRICLELAPENPWVQIDRVEIQQVLVNLLRNALEAEEAAGTAAAPVVARTTVAGDRVEIAVIDHGPGLPGQPGLDIFEPFVTTKTNGLGLGLAISRTIVEGHRSELQAISNPEGGAVFRFSLECVAGGGDEQHTTNRVRGG